VAADGSWFGDLDVAEGANPDHQFSVHAECFFRDNIVVLFIRYEPVPFDMTEPTTNPPMPRQPTHPASTGAADNTCRN
jgi:hypothetical protein